MPSLDLSTGVVALTEQLMNIESVSHQEGPIADAVEAALRPLAHLSVERIGNTVVARTELGRGQRVVLAGHLDTVPVNDNLPARREGGVLHGLGSCDMKGGVAAILGVAASLPDPRCDLTLLLYDCEEVEAIHNGLTKLSASRPELMQADFAILMEPSNADIEAGCQGSMTVDVTVTGERAHAARAWMGVNAIHRALPVLEPLAGYEARRTVIDGLEYREGLNAVGIRGGVANNVLPDECVVTVNHRFAPDRSEADAEKLLRDLFEGFEVTITDSCPSARPGLDRPAARDFVAAVGGEVRPKFGWTDVGRFSTLGVPAVNYGPGDPMLAHKQEEHVETEQIERCESTLRTWLEPGS